MTDTAAIADALFADWQARAPYRRLTGPGAPADLAAAYRIQSALQARLAGARGAIAGRKIALSSAAMQAMVGIAHPIAGAFFARDILTSPAEVRLADHRHLGVEFEVALRLARDVAPGTHTAGGVAGLIDAVAPAFELIEDRGADYAELDVLTLVADNAWCAGVVLGPEVAGCPDPSDLAARLIEGDAVEEVSTAASAPLEALAWVLTHLGGQGVTARAGEWVIAGSCLRTRFPAPGTRYAWEVAGVRAEVTLR